MKKFEKKAKWFGWIVALLVVLAFVVGPAVEDSVENYYRQKTLDFIYDDLEEGEQRIILEKSLNILYAGVDSANGILLFTDSRGEEPTNYYFVREDKANLENGR